MQQKISDTAATYIIHISHNTHVCSYAHSNLPVVFQLFHENTAVFYEPAVYTEHACTSIKPCIHSLTITVQYFAYVHTYVYTLMLSVFMHMSHVHMHTCIKLVNCPSQKLHKHL